MYSIKPGKTVIVRQNVRNQNRGAASSRPLTSNYCPSIRLDDLHKHIVTLVKVILAVVVHVGREDQINSSLVRAETPAGAVSVYGQDGIAVATAVRTGADLRVGSQVRLRITKPSVHTYLCTVHLLRCGQVVAQRPGRQVASSDGKISHMSGERDHWATVRHSANSRLGTHRSQRRSKSTFYRSEIVQCRVFGARSPSYSQR